MIALVLYFDLIAPNIFNVDLRFKLFFKFNSMSGLCMKMVSFKTHSRVLMNEMRSALLIHFYQLSFVWLGFG